MSGLLTGYTHETALLASRKLLSQQPLPDAVFATDSLKLMSLYRVAAEKNISIPKQLAVVGYSNELLSFMLTPVLVELMYLLSSWVNKVVIYYLI